jgi:hypothetical protein
MLFLLCFRFPECVNFIAGLEGAKKPSPGYKCPPPDSDPFSDVEFGKHLARLSSQFAASANLQFEFHKRSELFIGTHDETLSIIAIRVSNPDCSPVTIHG